MSDRPPTLGQTHVTRMLDFIGEKLFVKLKSLKLQI